MIQHPDGATTPVIDASVHIFVQSNKDLRKNFMAEPYRSRGFPDYEMDWYGAPGGEYTKGSEGPDRQYPGSDPEIVGRHLFDERGVDVAILHPMTRGIMPDRHLGTAIAAGHNEMMVTRWLDDGAYRDRFRGTIRINPDDVTGVAARDREVQGPPQGGADRRAPAVARGLRKAAVLAAVGGGRRREPSGRRAHRGRARASRSRRRPQASQGPTSSTSASWR